MTGEGGADHQCLTLLHLHNGEAPPPPRREEAALPLSYPCLRAPNTGHPLTAVPTPLPPHSGAQTPLSRSGGQLGSKPRYNQPGGKAAPPPPASGTGTTRLEAAAPLRDDRHPAAPRFPGPPYLAEPGS